jgi:Tfp pilus assembly protein PilF
MQNFSPSSSLRRDLRRAVSALQRGQFSEAVLSLAELTTKAPKWADAWHYLALATHQLGREMEAWDNFRRARSLAPERADFALNEARFLLERNESALALEAATRAAQAPHLAEDACLLTADALSTLGQGREAITHLKTFFGKHPDARRSCLRLVALLLEHGEDETALSLLAEAVKNQPADQLLGPLYVEQLRKAGHHEEALTICRRLISSPSPSTDSLVEMAYLALERGDTESVLHFTEQILRKDPVRGEAWIMLAMIGDPARTHTPPENLTQVNTTIAFAHAKLLDRRSEIEASWQAYEKANRLAERDDGGYDRTEQEQYTNDLIQHLNETFIETRRPLGRPGRPVIFICGVSRSGTTLLEQMLAAHPSERIMPGGEMKTIHRLIRRHFGPQGVLVTGQRLAGMTKAELRKMLDDWTAAIEHKAMGKPYITDKMPSNALLLGLLEVAFPEAPIILLERDPVAIACSCFVTPFAEEHTFSHRLSDIGHYFAQYRRVVTHWETVLPPGRIQRLRYEDLVTHPRESLSALLNTLGLEWDEVMLDFYRHHALVSTASVLQVRQPLDPKAVEGWRRFARHLEPWRERLEAAYYNGVFSPDEPA